MKTSLLAMGLCAAIALTACGPAAPAPTQPTPPPVASDKPPEPEAPLLYSKFTDPLYLAYSDEQNVFGRRTLARLWVAVAQTDPPSDAQKVRLEEASSALEKSEQAVGAQSDVCEAGIAVALERAQSTKNQLEQQYLDVAEKEGEQSLNAKRLDAQVHLLIDEVEALRKLAEPCPKAMFDEPEGAI